MTAHSWKRVDTETSSLSNSDFSFTFSPAYRGSHSSLLPSFWRNAFVEVLGNFDEHVCLNSAFALAQLRHLHLDLTFTRSEICGKTMGLLWVSCRSVIRVPSGLPPWLLCIRWTGLSHPQTVLNLGAELLAESVAEAVLARVDWIWLEWRYFRVCACFDVYKRGQSNKTEISTPIRERAWIKWSNDLQNQTWKNLSPRWTGQAVLATSLA